MGVVVLEDEKKYGDIPEGHGNSGARSKGSSLVCDLPSRRMILYLAEYTREGYISAIPVRSHRERDPHKC